MISVSRIAPFILLNEGLGFSDLSGSPMCVNGMKLLIHARDSDGIPLTRSGAFFRKFVTWAAESFHWPEYEAEKLYVANKVLNEPDFFPLAVMHDLLLGARLMRHYNGKAVLTKTGKAMIGDYGALQVAGRGVGDDLQPIGQSWPRPVKTRTPPLSIASWQRQPSNFTSTAQPPLAGGLSTSVGVIGWMKASLSRMFPSPRMSHAPDAKRPSEFS